MKERDYTLSVDAHVSKEDSPSAKRWYSLKIYGHPILQLLGPLENMKRMLLAENEVKKPLLSPALFFWEFIIFSTPINLTEKMSFRATLQKHPLLIINYRNETSHDLGAR